MGSAGPLPPLSPMNSASSSRICPRERHSGDDSAGSLGSTC
ncbi:Uncharacterised protein [Mycobacteroides abscessus subsp. abscessus]|nr:Uncharacterised protein [Mycobacteroides abscessus subsp. abscessus]SKT39473.1 Uncharacterised protein [Mycobacteroides abscessus subsp. abscessus]SKU90675.1 Uncharacterised protein [Mycobacteroides abscessus subsp. abscessus]